jgi:hypothetical protein
MTVTSVKLFIPYIQMEGGRRREIFPEPVYKFTFKKCFCPRLKPVPLHPLSLHEGDGKLIVIPRVVQYNLPLGHFAVETRSVTRSSLDHTSTVRFIFEARIIPLAHTTS